MNKLAACLVGTIALSGVGAGAAVAARQGNERGHQTTIFLCVSPAGGCLQVGQTWTPQDRAPAGLEPVNIALWSVVDLGKLPIATTHGPVTTANCTTRSSTVDAVVIAITQVFVDCAWGY
jgi:hypothetical protein